MPPFTKPAARITVGIAAAFVALGLTLVAYPLSPGVTPASATSSDQVIDPEQQQGDGRVVRDSGHLDFGPTLLGDTWRLQIHDDSEATSYWRTLADVAIRVSDAALLTVPDSPEFAFLPAAAGTEVHVISQTQQPGIIWLGWNTQHPGALARMGQGVTVTVTAVTGPGDVSVFLQNGNFGAPDEIWNSGELPGTIWMERNTHTHANWVFTKPGAYLVDITFDAELADGSIASVSDSLRFAVGDATEPESAFALEPLASPGDPGVEGSQNDAAAGAPTRGANILSQPIALWVAGGAAILAAAGGVAAVARTRRRAGGAADAIDPGTGQGAA